MIDTAHLLDAAKKRQSLPSDYKLGLTLGLSDSALSNYRNGRSHPDDATASRLAELAGLDAGYVVACMHAERAKTQDARVLWRGIAARLEKAGLACFTAFLALWIGGGPDAGAMAATPGKSDPVAQVSACGMAIFEYAHCRTN